MLKTKKVKPIFIQVECDNSYELIQKVFLYEETYEINEIDDDYIILNINDCNVLAEYKHNIISDTHTIEISDSDIYTFNDIQELKQKFDIDTFKHVEAFYDDISEEDTVKLTDYLNYGIPCDICIEVEEYFDQKIGEKVKILNRVHGYNIGDFITLKGYNHNGYPNIISFEEDDEYNCGFHINHLNIIKTEGLVFNNDNFINIIYNDNKYSELDILKLLDKLCRVDSGIVLDDNSVLITDKSIEYTVKEWFYKNK